MRFTRLTVVGSQRRGDVVLPSDEELAVLLPDLLELVDEPPGPGAVALVRPTGDQLDLAITLDAHDVPDGEVLRVMRAQDAPPPAEVADVTEVATAVRAGVAGQWSEAARRATGAAGIGVLVAAAGLVIALDQPGPVTALAVIASAVILLVAAATARGLVSLVAGAAAAGLGVAVAVVLADLTGSAAGYVAGAAVGWLALAAVGGRSKGPLTGALTGLGLTVLAAVPGFLRLPADSVAGIVAVVAVLVLGLLPTLALTAAGVHRLDDSTLEGHTHERSDVVPALATAYSTMSWATAAVAATIAGAVPVLLVTPDATARALAGLVLLVVALRARPMPLVTQVAALWAAVVLGVAAGSVLAWRDAPYLAAGVLLTLAVTGFVATALRPNIQQRARWRSLGNTIELLAVLALFPVLLGVLGVFDLMLGVF
ncbi:EsaB/YukD family protein [Myceligenerans crystallogenes]|uniref:EccD-like transmembrane domain-containing protein n=1 Tax=Myceligenerans crystallogenes TaxID=316335 RepID=A0ABN2N8Y2_9MICO